MIPTWERTRFLFHSMIMCMSASILPQSHAVMMSQENKTNKQWIIIQHLDWLYSLDFVLDKLILILDAGRRSICLHFVLLLFAFFSRSKSKTAVGLPTEYKQTAKGPPFHYFSKYRKSENHNLVCQTIPKQNQLGNTTVKKQWCYW